MNTLADRFWVKVDQPEVGCWEWQAHRDAKGYGRINVDRTPRLAHRLSWTFVNGAIPPDLYVCHHCDNPPCVRPDHLFLGTPADNNNDKLAKGRGSPPPIHRGVAHHNATLPDEVIREARESYAAGREYQHQIAARLGVTQPTVGRWVRGDVRPEAGGPVVPRRLRRSKRHLQEVAA